MLPPNVAKGNRNGNRQTLTLFPRIIEDNGRGLKRECSIIWTALKRIITIKKCGKMSCLSRENDSLWNVLLSDVRKYGI
jgi:hypothetical protein